jgi:hypothetical protein
LKAIGSDGKTISHFMEKIDKVFENPAQLDSVFQESTTRPPELYEALKRLTGGDNK